MYALQPQQRFLLVEPARIAREAAICTDDAVTGNEDGDRVAPDRTADGLRRHPSAACGGNMRGDPAVRRCRAVGNPAQDIPDRLLKCCAVRRERRQSTGIAPREVHIEPTRDLLEHGEVFLRVLH